MTENYWEHPTYGRENRDHKTMTVTFARPLSRSQVEALFDNAPQLDDKFGMDYLDGDLSSGKSFSHDWEKTDRVPRGVAGYEVTTAGVRIWASEQISAAEFTDIARHVLTETAGCDTLGALPVSKVETSGVAIGCTPGTLTDVASSIRPGTRTFKSKPSAPGM